MNSCQAGSASHGHADAAGMHVPSSQVEPEAHEPQSSASPQPSSMVPQVAPSAAQVMGTQAGVSQFGPVKPTGQVQV
ncbi:hypothetical protein BE11_23270 [Sorangium cellulosum]|nr:hypothetical protein BE11_23270 [Sorangium cellulosum]